jgi:hypothetical protein
MGDILLLTTLLDVSELLDIHFKLPAGSIRQEIEKILNDFKQTGNNHQLQAAIRDIVPYLDQFLKDKFIS